jgi:integrase/recombinase XerD
VDVPLSTSTTVATRDELFSANEQLALAGFLAGYSGLTRDAYTLDLRQFVAWCTEHRVAVFGARRADIECFARHRVAGPGPGHDRATVVHRVLVLSLRRTGRPHRHFAGGTRAATAPGLRIPRRRPGPQAGGRHARGGGAGQRPGSRADQPARPQRAAGLRSDRHGYRDLGLERGHRALTILRKGAKS